MRPLLSILPVLLLLGVSAGCGGRAEIESLRSELLALNEQMREAHLSGDFNTVIAAHAYPYVRVQAGVVSRPTAEENDARFRKYLTGMKLVAWDDLEDPVIMISDDGSLATVIYRKRLAMRPMDAPDSSASYDGIYAWQSTYRRTDEGWKMIADITTSLPDED